MAGSKNIWILTCLSAICLSVILARNGAVANVSHPKEIVNRTDLSGMESTRNAAKVVGVKKHKNYEIVVYEYDDSGENDEKSGKKNENSKRKSPVEDEVNNNSVELFPTIEHPTPPPPLPRRLVSNKPRVTLISTTTKKSYTMPFPIKPVEGDDDPLESSASEEVTSVESKPSKEQMKSSEEESTPAEPTFKPPPKAPTSLVSFSGRRNTTTAKPQLPQPFRTTKAPTKKKSSASSASDEYDDDSEYEDDDDYSDEDLPDSKLGSRRKTFEEYYYGRNRGQSNVRGPSRSTSNLSKSSPSRRGGSVKKPLPKRFGSRDDDVDEYDDDEYDDDDLYSDEKDRRGGSNKRKSSSRTTTESPNKQRKSSGGKRDKVTPKPFFPLIYDEDSDEFDDDDNDAYRANRKSSSKRNGSNSRTSKVDSPTKSSKRRKGEKDEEGEDEWGIDKSLKCKDPNGKQGICQEYSRCSIFYQELIDDYDEPIDPTEYKCRLPTQIGICCPLVSENDVVPEGQFKNFLGYCEIIQNLDMDWIKY